MQLRIDTVQQLFESLRDGAIFKGTSPDLWLEVHGIYVEQVATIQGLAVPRKLAETWSYLLTEDQFRTLLEPVSGGVLFVHDWGVSLYHAMTVS